MEEKKLNITDRIKNYLKETQAEAKKVSWPDQRYVYTATSIIVAMVLILAAALMALDYGLGEIIVNLTKARF